YGADSDDPARWTFAGPSPTTGGLGRRGREGGGAVFLDNRPGHDPPDLCGRGLRSGVLGDDPGGTLVPTAPGLVLPGEPSDRRARCRLAADPGTGAATDAVAGAPESRGGHVPDPLDWRHPGDRGGLEPELRALDRGGLVPDRAAGAGTPEPLRCDAGPAGDDPTGAGAADGRARHPPDASGRHRRRAGRETGRGPARP